MKKGENTKQAIVDKAKELFRENGYINTKMKDITDALGYQPSFISYYFKNKGNLVYEIYKEASVVIDEAIHQYCGNIKNPMLKRFISNRLMFKLWELDPDLFRLRYEVALKGDSQNYKIGSSQTIINEIEAFYNKHCTNELKELMQQIYYRTLDQVVTDLYEGKVSHSTIPELSVLADKTIPFYLGIDIEEINYNISLSKNIANLIDLSNIKIL